VCQFCLEHGEGKKWYLQAKNYAEELANDLRRRRRIRRFLLEFQTVVPAAVRVLQALKNASPAVRRAALAWGTEWAKREHFGQVIPLEDVEQVLALARSVVLLPCLCRRDIERRERAYCLGLSILPHTSVFEELVPKSFWEGPDGAGLQRISSAEALALMRQWELEGVVHTVWAYVAPFVGGMCNCRQPVCYAMQCTLDYGLKLFFRAEYVAVVRWEACVGCGECAKVCPFSAIEMDRANAKARVDPLRCYGCGICRAHCPTQAIFLRDRRLVPQAAGLW